MTARVDPQTRDITVTMSRAEWYNLPASATQPKAYTLEERDALENMLQTIELALGMRDVPQT